MLVIAATLVFDGLTGPQLAPKNLTGVSVWVHYRGLLVLALVLAGNLFCFACPLMLPRRLGKWMQTNLFRGGRPFPRKLRNKWLAIILLILFFFAYERWDLWASPWLTAWLILAYFIVAFAIDTIFQGASFCKYVCPVGQFNFLGSLISPTEIRVRNADACTRCVTKDCIRGRDLSSQKTRQLPVGATPIAWVDKFQSGCELNLFQPMKIGNQDCTFCLDCVHACPHDNVTWAGRLPAAELWSNKWRSSVGKYSQRFDVATLIIVLTFGGFMNAFGMVRPVYNVINWLTSQPGFHNVSVALVLIFGTGLMVLPSIFVPATAELSRRLGGKRVSLRTVIARNAPMLVPIGFGMWLAHYLFHFLTGGLTLIPVLQHALARWGLASFGSPDWQLGPLAPPDWLFPIEIFVLYCSLAVAFIVGFQINMRAYENRNAALKALLPWLFLCVLLVAAGVWILAQPMEMRGTLRIGL